MSKTQGKKMVQKKTQGKKPSKTHSKKDVKNTLKKAKKVEDVPVKRGRGRPRKVEGEKAKGKPFKEYCKDPEFREKHLKHIKEKITCECGFETSRCNLTTHKKKGSHIKRMKEIEAEQKENAIVVTEDERRMFFLILGKMCNLQADQLIKNNIK